MKKGLVVIMALLLFVSLWSCSKEEEKNTTEDPKVPVGINKGNLAPDFTMQTLDGKEVTLSKLRGKPVHLVVWSTGCGFCVEELVDVQKIYNDKSDKYEVLAVNFTAVDGEEAVKAFIKENNYNFTVLKFEYNEAGANFQKDYNVGPIPLNVFINKEGKIEQVSLGRMQQEDMEALISRMIGE